MLVEDVDIRRAAYGIYRPEFENHVYRRLRLASVSAEPFNRGLDDNSLQHGTITVDGLVFAEMSNGGIPLIQISDNNPSGAAASHFRNVEVVDRRDNNRRALVDRGGGPRPTPRTETSVPIYLHDYYGPGRHALVMSTAARDFPADDKRFRAEPPLTGSESRVCEVTDVEFPELLQPVDDLPPATIITYPPADSVVRAVDGRITVRGTTTDNTATRRVRVNGVDARDLDFNFHQWEVTLTGVEPGTLTIEAQAEDESGNVEQTPHRIRVEVR
jgi:hypothetical protein